MLLLAAHNPGAWNLTAMAFSWLEEQAGDQAGLMNPDFPPPSEMSPYSEEEISKRIDCVTKRVNGLARGFLEVKLRESSRSSLENGTFFASEIQFCHRTARDYLLHNEDRNSGLLKSFPNFDKSSVYTRIRLAEIIHGHNPKEELDHEIFYPLDRSLLGDIDPYLVDKFKLALRGSLRSF